MLPVQQGQDCLRLPFLNPILTRLFGLSDKHCISKWFISSSFSRGNLSHEAFLRNARNSEETLRKEAIERTDLSHLKDVSKLISVKADPSTVYKVQSTGAVVSLNSAVGLIHFYCSQLPSDRFS